ncbi:MAG: hypothetical protein IKE58_12220 [Blautia sp.]|nr:hypothetical protein [Blautia sp.]
MKLIGGQDFEDLGGTVTSPIENREGVGHTWNIILDNLKRLIISSLLCALGFLPLATGIFFGFALRLPPLLLLAGVIGGAISGPAYGTMIDGILVAFRGLPGRWWERYTQVFRREWKNCLLPGMVQGLFLAMAVNVLMMVYDGRGLPPLMLLSLLVAALTLLAVNTWFWPQRMLIDLNLIQLAKNSLLMTMMHPKVTWGAVAVLILYWAFIFILYPYSSLFLVVLGFWFPSLMQITITYRMLNGELKIEERLEEKAMDHN